MNNVASVSNDESTWVLTTYLVANAIVLPMGGWASSVIGRKNFFMLCIIIFTAASFLCGIATSLPLLLLSSVFVPVTAFPGWLQTIIRLSGTPFAWCSRLAGAT